MNETPALTCICCGSGTFRHFRTIKRYHLLRCVACRFVTVHPLPDIKTLEAYYNDTRTGEEKQLLRKKLSPESLAVSNNPKRDFFSSVLAKVSGIVAKPVLDILEIGSG